MLPPATRRSGESRQGEPMVLWIAPAMTANISMGRSCPSGQRQLREALSLAAQERPETELIIKARECRHVGNSALESRRPDAEPQVTGDVRQAPGEVHRLAVVPQPRAEGRG